MSEVASSDLKNGHTRSCGCLVTGAPVGNKYNLGKKRSKETRQKQSRALSGRRFSKKHCENIKKSRTPEFKARMSKRVSGEGNPMFGKKTAENVKSKLRAAMLGNQHLLGHRHSPTTLQKMSDKRRGEKHWNWRGGLTAEEYCPIFNLDEFKGMIKDRDGYKCQNPDCWGKSTKLCCHHIDYDKMNCSPSNLITLCVSCNIRANYGRERHEEFYSNIIKAKYADNGVSKRS